MADNKQEKGKQAFTKMDGSTHQVGTPVAEPPAAEQVDPQAIVEGLHAVLAMKQVEIPEGADPDNIKDESPPDLQHGETAEAYLTRVQAYMARQSEVLQATKGFMLNRRLAAVHQILGMLVIDEDTMLNDDSYRGLMKQVSKKAHVQSLKRPPKNSDGATYAADKGETEVMRYGWTLPKMVQLHKETTQVKVFTTQREKAIVADSYEMFELLADENEVFGEFWAYLIEERENGNCRQRTLAAAKREQSVEIYFELEPDKNGLQRRVIKNARPKGGENLLPQDEVANVERFGDVVLSLPTAFKDDPTRNPA